MLDLTKPVQLLSRGQPRPHRVVCTDARGVWPIVALLDCAGAGEVALHFNERGDCSSDDGFRLVNAPEPAREVWVNIHPGGQGTAHETREHADHVSWSRGRIACVRVEYRPGDGLEPAAAPAPAEPLPKDILYGLGLDDIRAVLAGNVHRLSNAFIWEETSQGYGFWDDQYRARQLAPEGRAILEATLVAYTAAEPEIIGTPSADAPPLTPEQIAAIKVGDEVFAAGDDEAGIPDGWHRVTEREPMGYQGYATLRVTVGWLLDSCIRAHRPARREVTP